MSCRGFDSYAGPCGASDCSTCNPRTYRRHQEPKREHHFCKCGMDRCRFCDPEYICMSCGFCPVDHDNPDEIECVPPKRVSVSPDFDDGLPF